MSKKIVIVVTHGKDDVERASMAFHVAGVAVNTGQTATVFLMVEGAWLATKGYADELHQEGLPPLKELINTFLQGGGEILVCGTCAKIRGFGPEDVIEGARIAGAINLVELMADGNAVLSM